nr:hypothetical protein [Tanacetum cinerariifolium]
MDLFSLIRAPNPTKVKTGSRPRASYEVHLLTLTTNRVIEMEDPAATTDSSGVPSTIERSSQGTVAAGDPESENASFASAVGSPESIYRPEWGVANGNMLDTSKAWQDLVDHAEADMKKAAEDKNARLSQELEDMRALFSDLQVSNDRLSQQVATLQEQVSGEEKLKAALEEFKQYEDSWVEQRCAEMDARLDALSIDFDEELYPHMLTAIVCRRQAFADVVSAGIAKGMSEGLRHGVEHGRSEVSFSGSIRGLERPPMDVIMDALYLESHTEDDALQWVRDLRPSSSQLTIPVYPEVRNPVSPWACKVGSAHHTRSDGVPVSVPTVVPQGLALLLADAATQTDTD